MTDVQIAQRIRDWFQAEHGNQPWQVGDSIADEINAMIAELPEPLPPASHAWKTWNDYESDTTRVDPGLQNAMTLCKFAEWQADVVLGLTDRGFEGVPRIIIKVGEAAQ